MTNFTTADGTQIFFKDWGRVRPVVFSYGWPLSADAWEAQTTHPARSGFRAITHDRRGQGRSARIAPHATLKVYLGGAHGLADTAHERLNADLLDFVRG